MAMKSSRLYFVEESHQDFNQGKKGTKKKLNLPGLCDILLSDATD
jgi:hypothetical protein